VLPELDIKNDSDTLGNIFEIEIDPNNIALVIVEFGIN
jgi:hypothetical protein